MTFEPWKESSLLIRFEHILEKGEDPVLSAPVRFDLQDVFPGFEVDMREVSLSANQWAEDLKRLHFSQETASDFLDTETLSKALPLNGTEITLNPMEIRSFIISLSAKV